MSHGNMDLFSWAPPAEATERVSVSRRPAQERSIDERFAEFHEANPHVLEEMLRLARARLDRGERRFGSKALYEELRQSLRVRKIGDWKLNNSYTALYARACIAADPRLADVIEVRRRKS